MLAPVPVGVKHTSTLTSVTAVEVPGIVAGIGAATTYRVHVVLPRNVTNPFVPTEPPPSTVVGAAAAWVATLCTTGVAAVCEVGPPVPNVAALVPIAYFDPTLPANPSVACVPAAAAFALYEICAVKPPPLADWPAPLSS